jgi:uncharacterized cupredoxin-like copper-binding protein
MSTPRLYAVAVPVAAAAIGLAACGDNGSSSTSGGTTAGGVDVVATEYAFDVPSEVEGGLVTFNFENQGGAVHEYAFGKIDEGTTPEEVDAAIDKTGKLPDSVQDAGTFGIQTAGASISATQQLDPGAYEFLCFLPGPGGKSHLELGMHAGFTVSGDNGASAPDTAASVSATENGFDVPASIPAGDQTLELQSQVGKPFLTELVKFEPGKEIADVDQWFKSGFEGTPPATLYGGIFLQDSPAYLGEDFESGSTYDVVAPDAGKSASFDVD